MKQSNFEKISHGEPELGIEKLQNKDKFEIILKLFGSTPARDSFIEVCKKYAALRKVSLPDGNGENYEHGGRKYSPPQRANLHNQIMDTLQRLSLQKLAPTQEKVLFEMASREMAGQIIKDWVLAQSDEGEDDEDKLEEKRKHMSGPAYFHSLGKEH